MRVLFVGNSFTYYNNMPEILEALGPQIETRLIASGGISLAEHWENQETREVVRSGKWDFVVLQEQSALAEVFLVNGARRVNDSRIFQASAQKWVQEIQATGAKAIIVMHWARKDAPQRDQAQLNHAVVRAARHSRATVAPVSLAWALTGKQGIRLYDEDGHHPSPAGSYSQACVLYATLLGRAPVGLPIQVSGTEIEKDDGKVMAGRTVELVKLSASEAEAVQKAAWAAVKQAQSAGGYPRAPAPKAMALPRLIRGAQVDLRALTGDWSGPLKVYPFPATLHLRIKPEGSQFLAIGRASFGGKPDDIEFSVPITLIGSREIRFEDPKGPNKGVVRYRGSVRDGQLHGIAEILVKTAPIYGIGEWSAQKVPRDR